MLSIVSETGGESREDQIQT